MSFSFVPLAGLTVIFFAACLACLFALLLQKIFKKNFGRFRLVYACLFASAAIVCITLMLVFVPLQSSFTRVDMIYYGVLFFLAFLGTLFFRIVGTIFILLYITYVVTFSLSLYKWFGSPLQKAELVVTEAEFLYQGLPLPQKTENSAGVLPAAGTAVGVGDANNLYLVFSAVRLPQFLLLPLPTIWYRPEYICSSKQIQFADWYGSGSKINGLLASIIKKAELLESRTGIVQRRVAPETSSVEKTPQDELLSVFFTAQAQIPACLFLPVSFQVGIDLTASSFAVELSKR